MFPEDVIFFVGDKDKPKVLGILLGVAAGITLFLGPISGNLSDYTRLFKISCFEIGKRKPFIFIPHFLYVLSIVGRSFVRIKGTGFLIIYSILGIFGMACTCVSSTAQTALFPDLFHPSQYDTVSAVLGFLNLLGGAVAVGVYGFLWNKVSYQANVLSVAIVGLLCCLPLLLFKEEHALKLRTMRKKHEIQKRELEKKRRNRGKDDDEEAAMEQLVGDEENEVMIEVVEEESEEEEFENNGEDKLEEISPVEEKEEGGVGVEDEDQMTEDILEDNQELIVDEDGEEERSRNILCCCSKCCLVLWKYVWKQISPYILPFTHWNFFWVFQARFIFMFSIATFQSFLIYFLRDCVGPKYKFFGNSDLIEGESEAQSVLGIVVFLFGLISSFLGPGASLLIKDSRKYIVSISGLVMMISSIGFIAFHNFFTVLFFFAIPMGLGMGSFYAVDYSLQNDALPKKEEAAKDLAIFSTASNIPYAVASPIMGLVITFGNENLSDVLGIDNFGYYLMFGFGVFVQILGSIFILFVRKKKVEKVKKEEEQEKEEGDEESNPGVGEVEMENIQYDNIHGEEEEKNDMESKTNRNVSEHSEQPVVLSDDDEENVNIQLIPDDHEKQHE